MLTRYPGILALLLFLAGCFPTNQRPTGDTNNAPGFWPAFQAEPGCVQADEQALFSGDAVPAGLFARTVACALGRASDDQIQPLLDAIVSCPGRGDGTCRFGVEGEPEALKFRFVGTSASLGAGTSFGGLHFTSTRGHFDATAQVAAAFGNVFGVKARLLLADASQDPDLFEWTVMAAHGQTQDDNGRALEPSASKAEFVAWVRGHLGWVKANCKQHPRDALYRLGYLWHGVEDVAAHKGRTNPEHAANADAAANPDDKPEAYLLALDVTTEFVRRSLAGPLAECVEPFRAFKGERPQWSEKAALVGRSRDFNWTTMRAYQTSGHLYTEAKARGEKVTVRWFGEANEAVTRCSDDKACEDLLQQLVP